MRRPHTPRAVALLATLILPALAASPASAAADTATRAPAQWARAAAPTLQPSTGSTQGDATATVECPGTTVVGHFAYLGFTGTNQAAQIILQDGQPIGDTQISKSYDGDHFDRTVYGPVERPADGKTHQYVAVTTWAAPGPEHNRASDILTCAAVPVPTLPGCDGSRYPVGGTPPFCPPPPPAPAPPTAPAQPTKPPPPHNARAQFKCVCIVHIVKPNPNHPGGRHGIHPFGARLVTSGRIISTRLTVTAVGQGRPSCTGNRTAHRFARDQFIRIDLYDLHVWKHCLAWGEYRLTFRITIRVKDAHGHTHICICTRVAHFWNRDPNGHAGA